ncbi:hypothetical protein TNCV_942571 [Trichonephila clavipes]|nr:hypothetical protein TNCV_942571 [Trichonephila clavipes]
MVCTDRRNCQLIIRDPFFTARAIRNHLLPRAGGTVSTQSIRKLRTRVPEKGEPFILNSGLDVWSGVIVPGHLNDIRYCPRINLISVCGDMMAIDGYGSDLESPHFIKHQTGPTPRMRFEVA